MKVQRNDREKHVKDKIRNNDFEDKQNKTKTSTHKTLGNNLLVLVSAKSLFLILSFTYFSLSFR
jgi:hypothetical protein